MKITHITGETVDTDDLPDTEAMVLEKVEEFRQFCLDNKVPFIMFIDPKGMESAPYVSFWNFSNRVNNYEGDGSGKATVNIYPFINVISQFIYRLTNGVFFVATTKSIE